jgi:hypothetical protein
MPGKDQRNQSLLRVVQGSSFTRQQIEDEVAADLSEVLGQLKLG